MATIINASNSTGLTMTSDLSGVLQIQSANNTAVTVNTSNQVLTPLQPRFSAKILGSVSSVSSSVIVFNTVTFNVGSAYNVSSGIFTVPVTGYYQFNYNVRVDGYTSGNYFHCFPWINGGLDPNGNAFTIIVPSSSSYVSLVGSWIGYYTAGTTVGVYNGSAISAGTYAAGQCSFNGTLLG